MVYTYSIIWQRFFQCIHDCVLYVTFPYSSSFCPSVLCTSLLPHPPSFPPSSLNTALNGVLGSAEGTIQRGRGEDVAGG